MSTVDVVRPADGALPLPAAPERVLLPHEAATAHWVRSYADERREGTQAIRGLAFALLFSLPVWGLLIFGGVALVNGLS